MEKPRIRIRTDGTLPEASIQALDMAYGNGRRDAARSDIPEMSGWTPPPGFAGSNLSLIHISEPTRH